ncbi:hypothetical protein P7L75_01255 (plasmid) [Tistrella mobilis]|uniref:phage tail terminator protein n=1 Tax=Tistrella mobilis TaxID=171437 RepID=UPI003555C25E
MIAAARAIRDRLRAVAMPPLVSVAGAAELEAVREGTAPESGACYVIPWAEDPRPSQTSGGHRQPIAISVLTAVCIRTYEDGTGEAYLAEAETISAALKAALAGWTPDPADLLPIDYGGTRASQLAGVGTYWLVSMWLTSRQLYA